MVNDNTSRTLLENDHFAAYNGMKLITMELGYALAEMEIKDYHLNGAGIVQGGAIFTLADFAFAAASNAAGILTVGILASISYFKPPKGKHITAEATEITSSKKLCTVSVDVFDEDKTLIARFTGTGYHKI